MFTPNLQTLPQAQRTLWPELRELPPEFVLYGGTAIASPDNGIKVASLIDLAGMKAAVVQQRAEAKDYLDLDALMQHGIALPLALAAGIAIHGEAFNPQITLKALSYFDDGNLHTLSDAVKRRIVHEVAGVDRPLPGAAAAQAALLIRRG